MIGAWEPGGGRLPYGYRVGAGIGTLTAVDPEACGLVGDVEAVGTSVGNGVVV